MNEKGLIKDRGLRLRLETENIWTGKQEMGCSRSAHSGGSGRTKVSRKEENGLWS